MENRKSFILYTDTYEAIKDLTPEEKGGLLDAIYLYAMGEEVELPKGEAAMAWKFIRIALDRNDEKWEEIKKKRSEAGKRHTGNQYTRQNGTNGTSVPKMEQMEQNGTNGTVSVSGSVNDSVNVSGSGSVINKPTTATYEERLKNEPVMLQAIANSAATTPDAVIAMLPDFADQLKIDGKKHGNYTEWRRHLQNYILKKQEKKRNNGKSNDNNNRAYEPQKNVDYTNTTF